MLSKTDLQEINKIVVGSETRIKKELGTNINEVQRKLGGKINRVQKTLEGMDKFLDKELMADRKRIIRIEEHLNFPKN